MSSFKYLLKFVFIVSIVLQLNGCATGRHHYFENDGPPDFHIDADSTPDAVPKAEPLSKYGNPSSYVVNGHRYYVMKSAKGYDEKGIASWYGMKFYKQKTSSGEPYNVAAMTAAHKTLPLPTYVQVTNLRTGKQVIVKVNDRGPFVNNRLIDLSYVAAKKLGVTAHGTALVEVKAIDPTNPSAVLNKPEPKAEIGHAKIFLQMGAFSQKVNADRVLSQVQPHTHYPVVIKTAERNGQPLYRVQIGPIPNVDAMDAEAARLSNLGLGKPIAAVQ